jgi:hypothetical protein
VTTMSVGVQTSSEEFANATVQATALLVVIVAAVRTWPFAPPAANCVTTASAAIYLSTMVLLQSFRSHSAHAANRRRWIERGVSGAPSHGASLSLAMHSKQEARWSRITDMWYPLAARQRRWNVQRLLRRVTSTEDCDLVRQV